jgi:hypothetical protein
MTRQAVHRDARPDAEAGPAVLRTGPLQRLADAAPPLAGLRALRRAAEARGAPVQRASDYDGILPAHESYGDGFAYDDGSEKDDKDKRLSDFTYHHIIPENQLVLVTSQLKEISEHLKSNPEQDGGFGGAMGALSDNARAMWQKTRARNASVFVTRQFSDLGVKVSEDEAETLIGANPSLEALFAAFRDFCRPQVQAKMYRPPKIKDTCMALIESDHAKFDQPVPDVSGLSALPAAYFDVAALQAALPAKLLEARAGVRRGTTRGAYFGVLQSLVRVRSADAWFPEAYPTVALPKAVDGSLRRLVQQYAMAGDVDEVEKAVQWNPGNIHRGPSSKLRDSGGSDLEKLVNDGGNDFEIAAANVVSKEHFQALTVCKATMDSFLDTYGGMAPEDEGYDAKIAAAKGLVDAMVTVQGFGLTGFREDQWEQKGAKMNLRLDRPKIEAAGLDGPLRKQEAEALESVQ